jgi:uncharacterized protein
MTNSSSKYFSQALMNCFTGLGIVMGALFISKAMDNHTYSDRTISVKGLSEKDVDADTGLWKLDISIAGNDIIELTKTAGKQKQIIVQKLISTGFSASDIKSDAPYSIEDKMTDRFNLRFDPEKQARYILVLNISLETKDVTKLYHSRELVNHFIEHGIVFKGTPTPQFFYSKLNTIKPEMLKEAGKNARIAALELAQNTHSKIGKINHATQGAFSIRVRSGINEEGESHGKDSPYLRARVVTNVKYSIID